MKSRWSDQEARATIERYRHNSQVNDDIALRVYTSRLIGSDPSLVLHGGGNTSVKTKLRDDTGAVVDVLCVKGSGWDLGGIEPEGLPAVRLASLGALRERDALSDEDMVNAQRTRLLDANSPNPSVETLLHAFLPHKFIDHSHADAILAIADQPNAEELCKQVFGESLAVVPYIMPGFELAKLAAETYEENPSVEGMVLLKHGLFTFGESARQSYERHILAVDKAERFAAAKLSGVDPPRRPIEAIDPTPLLPVLRGLLGGRERRYVITIRTNEAIDGFLAREDLGDITNRGPATPDHVIRTKRVPLLLELSPTMEPASVASQIEERLLAYRNDYTTYVAREALAKGREVKQLDPDPRIVLVPGLGVLAAGATRKAARIAADIFEHTIGVIEAAEAIGRYEVLSTGDLFDMEYWSLEQAKLGRAMPRVLEGQVVYVSGAAGGIGEATARAFVASGASVYIADRDESGLSAVAADLGCPFDVLDVTDERAVHASVDRCVRVFGGIDGIISNAGIAPQGEIARVPSKDLKHSFEVNFFSHQYLASAAFRVLKAQGLGGFLLFNASKAAFNPGKRFGPYAIPKAAVVALMKQYAIEGGPLEIRSNAVNADRIRTRLLAAEDVESRARARGLDTDEYYRANLLGREVRAADVANAFVNLAVAPSTTGCVVTVDGGNIAASPR